ncbi:sodium-independent anion transporter [Halomicronema hongdechloris C2206]|uniref:Sodium-independent anion transporter n=1 Tax=Halomicronema hongdechloris C2206 TaxID=1641165 RepID=A0A1Z3HMM4_9CYAN|nr:sodium-dependent bicarbonate transport family permease [Halomicronema hongdechloris]ASC71538.1 sodium-independent anion transporter [Halomicronema hongdechloris C2206]
MTFVTATTFLVRLNIDFGGHMVAALALMESPAIIVGLLLVRLFTNHHAQQDNHNPEASSWGEVLRESFLNGSVFLLVGSLRVGMVTSDQGWQSLLNLIQRMGVKLPAMTRFPQGLVHGLRFDNLRGDFFGGITAAIVALPLALAFGVASGVGPIAGLYGAISVGFFAALFGGTPSQISGPTGPMTVVMASTVTSLMARDPETGLAMAFTVVMLGGVFQILFGVLRLGKYITLMPYTVISGFMSGIGVIIIVIEIGPLLGYEGTADVVNSLLQLPTVLADIDPVAAGLGGLTLAIVFAAPPRLNRILPAPLIALVFCTLLSVWGFPHSEIPRIGDIPSGFPSLQLPQLEWNTLRDLLIYSVMLAILGALDSLMTSLVADNITRTQHHSDRELIGQGIGNLISGLLGGLPGAGATMRTVINVQTGGKTPLSGIIHAGVLGLIAWKAGALTEPIPQAVLAGILIKVGIDIIDWGFLRRAHRLSTKGAGVMYLVLVLTVFVDLITAVAVGVFVANLLTIKNLTDLQLQQTRAVTQGDDEDWLSSEEQGLLKAAKGRILMFHLSGPMSFGAAKAISRRLSIVENYEILILDLSEVPRLGVTALLAIEAMLKDTFAQKRQVFLVGATGQVQHRLQQLSIVRRLPLDHWVPQRLEALYQALALIRGYAPAVEPHRRTD